MFNLYNCARLLFKKSKEVRKLTPCYYFSAEKDEFVKKARVLEKLKSSDTFSQSVYESGKYILFLKSDTVCLENNNHLVYKNYKDIQDLKKYGDSTIVFLDLLTELNAEVFLFAVDLEVATEAEVEKLEVDVDGKFVNVRSSLYFLELKESQFVTHARGLINFSKLCKFCCYCGGSLKVKEGGYQKKCSNCNYTHYPNLAPIGLTLIDDEKHEEVLLVRQQRHPPGMYTCVAGFIEPGESLEESVLREVAEEVGLYICSVDYCISQHWALPSCQLTLGCIATSQDKKVEIDKKEILDAKWVKANELKDAIIRVRGIKNLSEMNGKKLWAPPRNAVSHSLMVAWLMKYHKFELTL